VNPTAASAMGNFATDMGELGQSKKGCSRVFPAHFYTAQDDIKYRYHFVQIIDN